jgi:ApaG protein
MTDKNKRYTATTHRITVTVIPQYQAEESNPAIGKFIFSYHVFILNEGFEPVRLLSRTWQIKDSLTTVRMVKGEGVVGEQPVIGENQEYQYMSWSPINSATGKMWGTYTFETVKDGELFEVEIPAFLLHADFILN